MIDRYKGVMPFLWPFIALITLLIYSSLPYESLFVEQYYSNGFFLLYRTAWDFCFSWLPFPWIYIVLATISILFFRTISKIIHAKNHWWQKLLNALYSIVKLLSILLVIFYWSWGFNYKRINPLTKLLPMESTKMTEEELYNELGKVTCILSDLRSSFTDSVRWDDFDFPGEDAYRESLQRVWQSLSVSYAGHVRARMLYPKGSLLHFSTAGVYLPWAGEGHVDAGLHPLTWPFTMSHEMSHGYGFTGEDLCNFWALLACVNSHDPVQQYSGYFTYWRYLRSNAYIVDKERFASFWTEVPPLLKKDLYEVAEYSNRYPDILPKLRDLFYDNYLKSHGISEGLNSYSRIIVLADTWQKEYGTLQLTE